MMAFLKKKRIKELIPFVLCFIMVATLLCLLYTNTEVGDDNFFKTRNGLSFFEFIKNRANARVAVDSILTVLLQLPQWVWGITTAFMFATSGYCIVRLFTKEDSENRKIAWFVALFLLMYNFTDMLEAGWYSTTVNYIWPLGFGMISLIPIKNALDTKKEDKALIPLLIIAMIIGCGQEQMAAILACFYIIFTAYLYKTGRLTKTVLILCAVSFACLMFMLFSGDNKERLPGEARMWFPDFMKLSFLDKCYLGITLTAMDLILTENPMVTTFAILFPLFIYKTECKKWGKSISLIPLILECVNNIFYDYAWRICPKLEVIVPQLRRCSTFGLSIEEFVIPDWSLTVIILSALYIIPIILCAFMAFKDNRKYVALLVVLAGFVSRFIIGFTPSVYGAGYRTHIFLLMCFASLLALLADECRDRIDFSKLYPIMVAVCVLQFVKMEYYTILIK